MTNFDADVAVIGSGSGGLAAALACAQAGMSVIVFEQHYVAGGWCHSFSKQGFRFSPGVHYIGSLNEGQDARVLYEGLGVGGDLEFYEMNPDGYEHCHVNGRAISYANNLEENCRRFANEFPADRKGIEKYFRLLRRMIDQFPLMLEVNGWKEAITVPYRTRDIGRYGLFSLKSILDSMIDDPLAKGMLSIQCGDQGMAPKNTMFMLHTGVSRHYEHGGYYPKNGGHAIVQALCRGLRAHGGRVKRGHRVERILVEKHKSKMNAIGIRANGKDFRTRYVISNADPEMTYNKLVGNEHLSRRLTKRLARTRYSTSSILCFLVVDMDLRAAGMDSGNVWYGASPEIDQLFDAGKDACILEKDEFPGLFISVPTLKDPSSFDGKHHVLEVIAFVDHGPFSKFSYAAEEERSPEYLGLKAKLQSMFLKTLEHIAPGIGRHVVQCDIGTPTTIKHFIDSTDANIYGTEKSYRQIGPLSFRSRSEIEGLYLVGASTSAHGVVGSGMSGVQAAAKILGTKPQTLLVPKGGKIKISSAEPMLS